MPVSHALHVAVAVQVVKGVLQRDNVHVTAGVEARVGGRQTEGRRGRVCSKAQGRGGAGDQRQMEPGRRNDVQAADSRSER